jgi:hypothetical protein
MSEPTMRMVSLADVSGVTVDIDRHTARTPTAMDMAVLGACVVIEAGKDG